MKIKASKDFKSMQFDDFFNSADNSDLESVTTEDQLPATEQAASLTKKKSKKQKKVKTTVKSEEQAHVEGLKKLKDIDPEFFDYLQENDKKLLHFGDLSGSESEDEEQVHTPAEKLEVASDESDFEDDTATVAEEDRSDDAITLKTLKRWEQELGAPKVPIETIRCAIKAFNSALLSISGDDAKSAPYKVEGSAAFNGVLQLCILNLIPALKRFLGLDAVAQLKNISKCKKFKKVKSPLRMYLLDLVRLLESVTSVTILTVLLKHMHQLIGVLSSFSGISKPVLKRLITLWSSSEETVRILSFLCILKITRQQQGHFLNNVLKLMYLSYVKNSRFVNPSTLANINFMRRSLAEMFALDLNVSYQHAFLYIRQLAIHLRNAVTLKKKDSFQCVYNWQFVNSLRLWVDVLSMTVNKPQLQPLIYPLVSIITGTIKLIPSAAHFPLRFHCCRMLIDLSRETRTFVPVLPFILETLNSTTFNAQHKKLSMRPLNFTCILRVSKAQLDENAFRDETLEQVYALTLQYLAQESSSIAFPDLVIFPTMALKAYIKTSKNANYNRKLKQLLDKISENATFIDAERKKSNISLKEAQLVAGWENNVRNQGTPLAAFFASWAKSNEKKRRREAADSDNINDYYLPTIKKPEKRKAKEEDGPVELFPSSDESETELPVEKLQVAKKKVKKTPKVLKRQKEEAQSDDEPENTVDIVEDFDINDW